MENVNFINDDEQSAQNDAAHEFLCEKAADAAWCSEHLRGSFEWAIEKWMEKSAEYLRAANAVKGLA